MNGIVAVNGAHFSLTTVNVHDNARLRHLDSDRVERRADAM